MNYALLTIYADLLEDLERSRIATENRIRALRTIKGLTDSPEEERLAAIADVLGQAEKKATKELKKAVKAHPLGQWIADQHGVGEKQAGRLLGGLGDPYLRWVEPPDKESYQVPRRVSDLWSLCGYGDAARQVRRKGEKANWSATLKMRTHLIAVSCMKSNQGHYREIYDKTRKKYEDAVHKEECRRCGPRGKPAKVGSPLSDGHKHARALRQVCKEFLRDLWSEGRRVHDHNEDQRLLDPA